MNRKTRAALGELRRDLHRLAAGAFQEDATAGRIKDVMQTCGPSEIWEGVGGTGLVCRFAGLEPGMPSVLLRAELDAVGIPEQTGLLYRSLTPGFSHACGHDGHMAILAGLACRLSDHPPRGPVYLLFQPAEETGQGAESMLDDPRMTSLAPDWVFAVHNLPGLPLGAVALRSGTFAVASTGLSIRFSGRAAHASQAETGVSPAVALAQAILLLPVLPSECLSHRRAARATVTHAVLGDRSFGVTPGEAEICAVLRADAAEDLQVLRAAAVRRVEGLAAAWGLSCRISGEEAFPATINHAGAVGQAARAAVRAKMNVHWQNEPFPWSEDFGHFTARWPGALVGLGAGETCKPLHHADYDFPDDLIPEGVRFLIALLEQLQGE